MSVEGRFKIHLEHIEDYERVVTASIREGIPVAVTVENESGEVLHRADSA